MPRRRLTPPTMPMFIVSLILAALAALSVYADAKIPWISANAFLTLLIAWVLLAIGVLARRV